MAYLSVKAFRPTGAVRPEHTLRSDSPLPKGKLAASVGSGFGCQGFAAPSARVRISEPRADGG